MSISDATLLICLCLVFSSGEVFDYLVAHGRMKEKEARSKFRQVSIFLLLSYWVAMCHAN